MDGKQRGNGGKSEEIDRMKVETRGKWGRGKMTLMMGESVSFLGEGEIRRKMVKMEENGGRGKDT